MRLKRTLSRLHKDRRGAIAPVMILAFIFLGFMAVMILNTGQAVGDKVRVQNGADSAAMLQADWTARHLNTMSMNNVALVQSSTAMVTSFTTTWVVGDLMQRALRTRTAIRNHAWMVCPPLLWGAKACFSFYNNYADAAAAFSAWGVYYLVQHGLPQGVFTSAATVNALNRMNDHLVQALPDRVGRVTQEMMRQNDILSVFYYKACDPSISGCRDDRSIQGSRLPVDYGAAARLTAFREVCDAASRGSDGSSRLNFQQLGYPTGKGPYTGGGSSSNPWVRDYIPKETGLGTALSLFKLLYPSDPPPLRWILGLSNAPVYENKQTVSENEFTRKMDEFWERFCQGGQLAAAIGGVLQVAMPSSIPLPRPYQLKGNIIGSLVGAGSLLGSVSAACVALQEDFHFLAFATRTPRYRISASIYESAFEQDYAYGQSCVFNRESFDLYTQNWESKMMPARHMDKPDLLLEELEDRAPREFDELVQILKRAGNLESFVKTNVH